MALQQYLPLAVLKLVRCSRDSLISSFVATVLTACGIETSTRDGLQRITS